MRKEKSEKNVGYNPAARFFLMLFFAVMAILILIPLYALLLGTFKGGAELFVSGLNLDPTPEKLHLRAWRYLFTGVMSNGEYQPHDYFIWYKNSFLLVLVQGTLTLLISSMVAYGFSKYQFRGKNVLFLCVLLVMMIPLEILMLPMYTQINAMGLRDSYAGVMLPVFGQYERDLLLQAISGRAYPATCWTPAGWTAVPSTGFSSRSSCRS